MKKLISFTLLMSLLIVSCETQDAVPSVDENAVFQSFSTNGQTILPTSINTTNKHVKIEVDHDVDVTSLIPEFDTPEGYTVYANGVEQASGITVVDFTQPVTYELKNQNNQVTSWEVSAMALGCKILIDASHDGGVWWFPQHEATGFNPDAWHQGQPFANALRAKGFEVTELGRGIELTEEMFFGHYIVIRASGFKSYTSKELEVYSKLLDRGMNLVFFTDHKKNDPVDELGDHLGIQFKGVAFGAIKKFTPHTITNNITSIDYIAGSVITNTQNPNMEILGWLGENDYADLNMNEVRDANEPLAPPVMGILKYPNSRIFFIGDMNGIEIRPQPFIDNLIGWMGDCSQW